MTRKSFLKHTLIIKIYIFTPTSNHHSFYLLYFSFVSLHGYTSNTSFFWGAHAHADLQSCVDYQKGEVFEVYGNYYYYYYYYLSYKTSLFMN